MRAASILSIASLAIVFSTPSLAADMRAKGAPRDSLAAKIRYCGECHGPSGRGYQAYYAIPQIAGQPAKYLENQFVALAAHNRDNPLSKKFMGPAISAVSPETRAALAQHFSALKAFPAGGGPRNRMAEGEKIFRDGLPGENVPACSACHGANGEGSDLVPRVAGQMYGYTVDQLVGWAKGYRAKDPETPKNPNTMQAIAKSLTKDQISAVAAYLSRLD